MTDAEQNTVKIHTLHNTLKGRATVGVETSESGHIDPEKIVAADKVIDEMCEDCVVEIGKHLQDLSSRWAKIQKNTAAYEREKEKIFTLAHEIKDIAALCERDLIAYFAESLRDYIADATLGFENQHIIIQAHIDAITAAYKNDIRDDGGPAAEELKRMVKIAIEKYR